MVGDSIEDDIEGAKQLEIKTVSQEASIPTDKTSIVGEASMNT